MQCLNGSRTRLNSITINTLSREVELSLSLQENNGDKNIPSSSGKSFGNGFYVSLVGEFRDLPAIPPSVVEGHRNKGVVVGFGEVQEKSRVVVEEPVVDPRRTRETMHHRLFG